MSLAAFKNSEAAFDMIFEHSKTKRGFQQFVNIQNVEGFCALHFASFHGSHLMLTKLVEVANADFNIVNNQGCNVLHLAAQGNKALSIHYFSGKLDINAADSKMRTPLHWAVYTRSEVAQNFILAISSVELEARDDNGFTALHLAV